VRILLIHDFGTLNGGAEIMIWRLREALRERGHEVCLFTSTARPLPLPILADATCFGTVTPARRVVQAWNPHARWRLRRVLRDFVPDVVHVKMFMNQLSPTILPLLAPFPSLLHVINYNLICPLNTKTLPDGSACRNRPGAICHEAGCLPWLGVLRAEVQRRTTDLSVFDRIVANSRSVAERLRAEGVRVDGWVHNGVPVRAQRPALGEHPVVGYAGRLVKKKGVDVLLEGFALVKSSVPDAQLVIAGDGPEWAALETMTHELGIERSVTFTGHLDARALERALAPAWVQAVPSVWEEPFGLVAAEAMMRGTAVVATAGAGLGEQVVEGETGHLVPAGDAPALSRALESVLLDRERAERMGSTGREKAMRELCEERHVESVICIYDEMLAASSR
jgi:glycosyltransferase involved in cell wall biosynthesis